MNGAVLAIAWAAASGGGAATADPPNRFVVDASFSVDAPADKAWAVLTDYDHLSEFVPSMKASRLVERKDGDAVVEQEAQGRFLVFKRSVKIRLRVEESFPARITFEDTSHEDFDLYRGDWTIRPENGQLSVRYHLEALPSSSVPRWLVRRVLKESAKDLLDRVRSEIVRRATL